MSNDIVQIRRKTFDAEAMFVTILNIEDVARWCDGIIHEDGEKEGNLTRKYIKVPVIKPQNLSQTEAHVGDWVVRQGRGFKVYKDGALKGMFELKNGRSIGSEGGNNQQNRPKPNKQKNKPQQNRGPNPGQMPKKLAETPVAPPEDSKIGGLTMDEHRALAESRLVDQKIEEGKLPLSSPAEELVESTKDSAQQLPERGDSFSYDDSFAGPAEAIAKVEELRKEQGPEVVTFTSDKTQEEVVQEKLEEKAKYGPATVDATHAAVPGAITLDELNALPGDTRTQTDILRERALGEPGSEPVLDTDDERTPGEVFRGEG